ncbi:MAG: hypothetical protein ACP5O2_10565 [Bacteroidales bacterium]
MIDKQLTLFLLGGYDLEMLTIRRLLKRKGYNFVDKKLSWGAKLSAYKESFDTLHHYIGIELIDDITPPARYTSIDHHNNDYEKPSALEQVAALVGHSLTRYEQLVAANDKGYIPAMQALGASKEEILRIRRKDRAAQGISLKEEKIILNPAHLQIEQIGEILVVQTPFERFSPIVDYFYPQRHLIVFNDHELMYYGSLTARLVDILQSLLKENKIFYGGNPPSFLGTGKGFFSKPELEILKNQIISLSLNPNLNNQVPR